MSAIEKSYIYKVFRDGQFLGLIPNVVSPFKYTLNINSAGASLDIVVAKDPYEARDAVEYLITESGDRLITESGDYLTTERPYPIFGNDWDGALIRNGNDVQVFEVSADYPEGLQVFEGYMSRAFANFGGSGIMGCTVLSYGAELDNYIIQTGNTEQDEISSTASTLTPAYWVNGFAQTFTPLTNMDIPGIDIMMRITSGSARNVTIQLCQGNPDNDLVHVIGGQGEYEMGSGNSEIPGATATVSVGNLVAARKSFVFPALASLTAGVQYYFRIFFDQAEGGFLEFTTAGSADAPLVNTQLGELYYARGTINNASFGLDYDSTKPGFNCAVYSSGGSIRSPYTDEDPADILTSIIDNYAGQGGHVNYDTGTIEATGLERTYEFNLATALEGVKKVLELGPASWYWYVDPATSTIYYKEVNESADHLMVLGDHLSELNIELNIENVKNVVYFSGGDLGGGENLFIKDQDLASQALYPVGLARISDNRVTLSTTAQALIDNVLDNQAQEGYISQLVIPASVYDISLFNPGETIGFAGFRNFADRLVLQIVSVGREKDKATLALGMLPKRASAQIELAQRQLLDIQTVNNPDTPD